MANSTQDETCVPSAARSEKQNETEHPYNPDEVIFDDDEETEVTTSLLLAVIP
jgi:hypothetical protein